MVERQLQDIGGDGVGSSSAFKAQSKQIGSVDKKVNQNDSARAQKEGQGDIAAAIAQLGRDEGCIVPASIGEKDRHKRTSK
jgi:hypothetical protein